MARRPSTGPANYLTPMKSNVEAIKSPSYLSPLVVNTNGQIKLPPRTLSMSSNTISKHYNDNASLDPDELFTQRTIAEVKAVQLQLRQVELFVTSTIMLPPC